MGNEKTYIMLKPDCVKEALWKSFKESKKGLQDC